MNARKRDTGKERLIEAAIVEFGQKSFENASVNAIIKEAKLSKGAFYHHFSSKEELYLYLVGLLLDQKLDFMKKHAKQENLEGDLFQVLRESVHLGLRFAKEHPEISNFSAMLMKERGNPIFTEATKRYTIDSRKQVKALLEHATLNTRIRKDIPEEFVVKYIEYILENIAQVLDIQDLDDYEGKVHDLFKVLEHGLTESAR